MYCTFVDVSVLLFPCLAFHVCVYICMCVCVHVCTHVSKGKIHAADPSCGWRWWWWWYVSVRACVFVCLFVHVCLKEFFKHRKTRNFYINYSFLVRREKHSLKTSTTPPPPPIRRVRRPHSKKHCCISLEKGKLLSTLSSSCLLALTLSQHDLLLEKLVSFSLKKSILLEKLLAFRRIYY